MGLKPSEKMPHLILKFRLPADTEVENPVRGSEPVRDHILKAASQAGIPRKNIHDRSHDKTVEIDVVLQSDKQRFSFELACNVEATRSCND